MQLNIFCKKGKSNDGRTFPIYLSTLTKKDGTKVGVNVKFRDDAGAPDPKECPCVIEVEKTDANLVIKPIIVEDDDGEKGYLTDENGEIKQRRTLWVSAWAMVGPYVDTSLEEYE